MRKTGSAFTMLLAAVSLLLASTCSAQPPAKLIVKNARLFTMAQGQRDVFTGYLVVNEDGKLAAIAAGDPPAGLSADETWDAGGHWILPGFLSAHSHLWQAAFRGLAADKTLPGWIDGLYIQHAQEAKAEDYYWFTLGGALDHLQHGITAAYDFSYGGTSWKLCKGNDCDEASFRGEMASGIRFIHGYQPDAITAADTPAMAMARLTQFMEWIKTQPTSTRFLSVMLNGSTSFNETYQQAVSEKAMMDRFHLGNQSHYLEPPDTVAAERAKFKWFEDSGLLGPTLYFGHFIHPSDEILTKVAAAHSGMSWNPLSNGRLASGVADIPKYLKKGIRVGMGVDGEASADLADPFENMRTGLYAIRDKYEDATIMSPYQVLYLHTMGSADVMGVKDRLGSLEPGKYADFLVIDPTRFGTVFDPYASLVLITGERDLERVYVGGELKVDRGKLLGQNMQKIQTEINTRSAATTK
ncbi:MAG TPA: amidohydrolase family protein [Acidobacteriaceae bacterium]|jgi:cytosine/adenosine deaminase-related metal-dependent hydrolase|nr:amidohydrolase family protein [Acidobacteriaceae bacterium]